MTWNSRVNTHVLLYRSLSPPTRAFNYNIGHHPLSNASQYTIPFPSSTQLLLFRELWYRFEAACRIGDKHFPHAEFVGLQSL